MAAAVIQPKTWQEIAQAAQDHRDSSIAKVQPSLPDLPTETHLPLNVTTIPAAVLAPAEVEITERPVEKLLPLLACGQLTSLEVTNAFLRRAGLAQKLANCVTELLPERALERAKYLDDFYATHKRPIGPLHGLPISVKEHVSFKDLGLNEGYVSKWNERGEDDAYILQILWSAGCVFYVRTTQPQTLMHLSTSSNLYGETVNPFNRTLTAGGSSGGEGALVALRGSCLGIGTDIGGSIRSPCANNGIYGLRPTSFRMPMAGWCPLTMRENIVPVIGPMSTSLEGLKIFVKTVLAAKPWIQEPALVPLPWRDSKSHCGTSGAGKGSKLRIGVMWDDGVVKPHPPIQRAMAEVVEKAKQIPGVEVVEWKPYKHDLAWEIIASLYFLDGGHHQASAIDSSGEPWMPLSEFILRDNPHVKRHEMEDMWKWSTEKETYRAAYARVWNETATSRGPNGEPEGMVDVILCPVGPGAAPPLTKARYWGYTSQWNLLDYPAAVFPVTQVKPEIDVVHTDYTPMNEQDEYNYNLYDPAVYTDAPVSLQLVGRRFEDEKVIEALEWIKEGTGLPFVD